MSNTIFLEFGYYCSFSVARFSKATNTAEEKLKVIVGLVVLAYLGADFLDFDLERFSVVIEISGSIF